MPSPYGTLTLDETTQVLVADARTRMPGQRFDETSDNWKRLRVLAGALVDTHAHLDAVHAALDPFNSEKEWLTKLAAAFGVMRGGATSARRSAALRVRGTAGSPYNASMTLTHTPTGLRYRLNQTGTIPPIGVVDLDVVSVDVGSVTQLGAGEVLTMDPAQAGIIDSVEVQLAINYDGLDGEPDGDLRRRFLERLASAAQGGNTADWTQWCEEAPGVQAHRAFLYPHRNGLGFVDIACTHRGSGSVKLLNSDERAALLAFLSPANRPISAVPRALEVVEDPQVIKVTVTPRNDRQFAKDWDGAPVVLAYTPATRVVQFTAARPLGMRAGHRIVWDAAGGEYNVIASLVSSDSIKLADAPLADPVASQVCYSGGPLTLPIATALRTAVDELGPAVGDFGLDWDSDLTIATVLTASQSVSGALNTVVVSPATDYVPVDFGFPNDDQIPMVTTSRVFVKYA